ncbi:MAG: hypothetical protein QG596_1443 [Actinomycetota bacterium]|nr:hypothetical protein [Actinomycetota bacterium]
MIVLDATVVNVALPAIQDELGFSQSGLAWVVNAYLIASGTPRPEALTSGYELAFWVAAGLVVAALVVALIVLEPAPEPVGEEGPDGMTAEEVTAEAGTTL